MSNTSCSICTNESGIQQECKHVKGFVADESERETPSMERIEVIGQNTGYKVLRHNPESSNLELIAVPWTAEAIGCRNILDAICTQFAAKIVKRESHMHGRYAFLLELQGHFKQIHLSILPTLKAIPHFPHHFKPNERVRERGE